MKLSEGIEWTVHCCTVLGMLPPEQAVPGSVLAEFHDVAPAYLTKQLQALGRAGIVDSTPGRKGGYRLARPTSDISLLDIILAIEGPAPAFRCTEIRQQGPSGVPSERYLKPCGIAAAMWSAEEAWRTELAAVSILSLIDELQTSLDPEQAEKGFIWLLEQLT